MNPLVASKWVTAIRSGKYRPKDRSILKLHHEGTWSILGILCDLHAIEVGGTWVSSYYVEPGKVRGDKFKIPPSVVAWAGLKGPWVGLPGTGALGVMEDIGYSHAELSNIIEANSGDL